MTKYLSCSFCYNNTHETERFSRTRNVFLWCENWEGKDKGAVGRIWKEGLASLIASPCSSILPWRDVEEKRCKQVLSVVCVLNWYQSRTKTAQVSVYKTLFMWVEPWVSLNSRASPLNTTTVESKLQCDFTEDHYTTMWYHHVNFWKHTEIWTS